jgi:vacuolar-type H+-ATPase subunit I/STV1
MNVQRRFNQEVKTVKEYTLKTSVVLDKFPQIKKGTFLHWIRSGLIPAIPNPKGPGYLLSEDDLPIVQRVQELLSSGNTVEEVKEELRKSGLLIEIPDIISEEPLKELAFSAEEFRKCLESLRILSLENRQLKEIILLQLDLDPTEKLDSAITLLRERREERLLLQAKQENIIEVIDEEIEETIEKEIDATLVHMKQEEEEKQVQQIQENKIQEKKNWFWNLWRSIG